MAANGNAQDDFSEGGRPDVSSIRTLATLCQRTGVHDLEASVGTWSIRLHLDYEASDLVLDERLSVELEEEASFPVVLYSDWVGVFRRGLDPDSPVLAKEGQQVREGDVVGLIEAMQLLHEQRSDQSGKIVRFLVEDGSPVEFGQPLLEIQ